MAQVSDGTDGTRTLHVRVHRPAERMSVPLQGSCWFQNHSPASLVCSLTHSEIIVVNHFDLARFVVWSLIQNAYAGHIASCVLERPVAAMQPHY
jgi:hypothetical protein